MTRKRKSGLASVLSALPSDLKRTFSIQPEQLSDCGSSKEIHINETEDLIVQRVHTVQETIKLNEGLDSSGELEDSADLAISPPPSKKQKIDNSRSAPDTSSSKLEAVATLDEQISIAAPHYKTQKQVPAHLKKYFYQRHRYFSLYDEGCLLDEEGWYSVTPEKIANQIAERCRCDTVIDAFCGVGGNSIAFAQTCERVIALDISPVRLAIAKHNATIYGVADRIEFILCDYVSFAKSFSSLPKSQQRPIDVVFLSPPWGGPSYISGPPPTGTELESQQAQSSVYTLNSLTPLPGPELFALSSKISQNVAMFLPRNTSIEEISLLSPLGQKVEIEEQWMGSKLKALTCYFGGLAKGQAHLF
ncbi:SAM-dependent methyltransferase [Ceratobasidium sp. AG-Ba]|nr:SAM-dependent methyltransferase [Ceratobasidium sp. AG-Ba]